MPLSPQLIALIAGSIGASAIGGALEPNPFQERESFAGTGADPLEWLTQAKGGIGQALQTAQTRANEPIDVGQFATPQPPRTFSGGILPMSLGGGATMPAGAGQRAGQRAGAGFDANSFLRPQPRAGARRVGYNPDRNPDEQYGGGSETKVPGGVVDMPPPGQPRDPTGEQHAPDKPRREPPQMPPGGWVPLPRVPSAGPTSLAPSPTTSPSLLNNAPGGTAPQGQAAARLLLMSLQPQGNRGT